MSSVLAAAVTRRGLVRLVGALAALLVGLIAVAAGSGESVLATGATLTHVGGALGAGSNATAIASAVPSASTRAESSPSGGLVPGATPEASPTPWPHQAWLHVYKVVDDDGKLDTDEDRRQRDGWRFELELSEGISEDRTDPDDDQPGLTEWLISFGADATTATVTESLEEGFVLQTVACVDSDSLFTGERDGNSFTFEITAGAFFYECIFLNVPTDRGGSPTPAPSMTLPPTDAHGSAPPSMRRDAPRLGSKPVCAQCTARG